MSDGVPSSMQSHLYVRDGEHSHMAEVARYSGLSLEETEKLETELVSVTGCTLGRAGELLLMADFDVNRAAEFHFTHGGGVASAIMSPTTPAGMQRVEVQATAAPGQAMTVLIAGRGEYMVTVPDGVQLGDHFRFELPALSLQTLEPVGRLIRAMLRRGATGFGVKLYHSKSRQIVEVDAVEPDSPAAIAGFERHDSIITLAGVQVEGRVPDGLKEAMERVKKLVSEGVVEVEWVLRRTTPALPPAEPESEAPVPGGATGNNQRSQPKVTSQCAVGAVPLEWDHDEDEEHLVEALTPTLSRARQPQVAAPTVLHLPSAGADDGLEPEPEAEARARPELDDTVQQLVDAGATVLNTATNSTDFKQAILKFESALQLSPACEEAMYGCEQARKALEFMPDHASSAENDSSSAEKQHCGGSGGGGALLQRDGWAPDAMKSLSTDKLSRVSMKGLSDYQHGRDAVTAVETPLPRTLSGMAAGGGANKLMAFRVISGAKVRQGRETSSHFVREIEPGEELEVLEQGLDHQRRVRLRGTEGWVSVQAADGTLLLEESFRVQASPQVCAGEKKVYSAEVCLRRPSGYKTKVGTATITTKRLRWEPQSRRLGDAWQEEGVSIHLQRLVAASGRGGGFGLGLTDGFELVFDTGPAWWHKEAEIDEKATKWSLMFHRHGLVRDEFLSLLHGAQADCKRMENLVSPMTLVKQRVNRLCHVTFRTSATRTRMDEWRSFIASSDKQSRSTASPQANASAVLDRCRLTVRAIRDAIFIEQGEPMRHALMSVPGWIQICRDGHGAVRREGWVRLNRVGAHETAEIWRRRYLVLHSDSVAWHSENEAATRQRAPPTPMALFKCVEIVRLVDVVEVSAGTTPLMVLITVRNELGEAASLSASSGARGSGGSDNQASVRRCQLEMEMDREEDALQWMNAIWDRKQELWAEGEAETAGQNRRLPATLSEAESESEGGGEGGGGVDSGVKKAIALDAAAMHRLEQALSSASAMPRGLEEEDTANTELLILIVAYVENAMLTPYLGFLLRCARTCASESFDVPRLEKSLLSRREISQANPLWDISEKVRSTSDWAEAVEVFEVLHAAYSQAVVADNGIILEKAQAKRTLPSSLFRVLTDTRDTINEVFVAERCGDGEREAGRRVLGGDDLLPIFIFVAARSCDTKHAGGEALATMQEWMMRLGASTDASQEEYMGTTLGMALSALIHLGNGGDDNAAAS